MAESFDSAREALRKGFVGRSEWTRIAGYATSLARYLEEGDCPPGWITQDWTVDYQDSRFRIVTLIPEKD